jgi:hypothetical protein
MNVASAALIELKVRSDSEDGSLIKAVINSTSAAEVGVAVGLLCDAVSRRTLVSALNLREMLAEIPASPFVMSLDFESLAKVASLERRGQSWVKRLGDGPGAPEIEIIGQGNLCYDIVVRVGGIASFLKPAPIGADFIRPFALELCLESEELLRGVIELTRNMGMVQNPRFYMSVEDWQTEHAAESMSGLADLF